MKIKQAKTVGGNMKIVKGRWNFAGKVLCLLLSTVTLLFCLVFSAGAEGSDASVTKVGVGGFAYGARFMTDGVLISGFSKISSNGNGVSPCEDCGMKIGDLIKEADGKEISGASELSDIISSCEGKALSIKAQRNGKDLSFSLTPVKEDGSGIYRGGMVLKDSMAGIGTVTYVKTESGEFGSLGHGICDSTSGVLVPLKKGSAMEAEIGGVVKGKAGAPGSVKGYFKSKRLGNVLSNTDNGVFGVFSDFPSDLEIMEVGKRTEVSEGKAEIRSTLGTDGIKSYEISISKINLSSKDNKSFMITVTDPILKDRTGGIVQGMSGSPIIQNGRIIGAVTHVMVNDPCRGYGIFIDNMLNAAE